MHHELKTDPEVFQVTVDGTKTYEIRKDDRGFAVGDTITLLETSRTGAEIAAGASLEFTGRQHTVKVSHLLRGYGLEQGWVILSYDLRAEVASLKEERATSELRLADLSAAHAFLTQQLAAANSNNQQLRGALELAQLTLANYFEATRRMPECRAIDQNVGQVIKDALAATPDKFNPDWSLLEATQESLREHMALLAAANGRLERFETAMNPRKWSMEMYEAWHKLIPDTFSAFDALRRAALSDLPQQVKSDARDAARYRYLRNRDIENDFPLDGLFIGCIPDNVVLSMDDADDAIDAAISAQENKS